MAMSRDRKKSPEEMAALMAQLKLQKEKQQRADAIKNVRNGQYILFGIAVLVGGLAALIWFQTLNTEATAYVGSFAGVFLLLGILYYKQPHAIPILGLIFYGIIVLIAHGIIFWVIHAMVIGGLVRAIKYGKDYKAAVNYKESDPLDQGLFDELK